MTEKKPIEQRISGMMSRVRIGAVYERKVNAHYRVGVPLDALRRRGHEIVIASEGEDDATARCRPELLRGCDVVFGYRMLPTAEFAAVRRAVKGGAAFVWDTDDDLASLPRESPFYRSNGGANARRIFAASVAIAREAHVVTTSTASLAERYGAEGVERIEPIGNHLDPAVVRSRRRRHDGIVVGWTAGLEHAAELSRIPVVDALRRLTDARPGLRVVTLGVRLPLQTSYHHVDEVPIGRLQEQIGGWDVAIAPLADIPFNRTRSDVKLKEYGAAGTPWLASPIGPYAGLGEHQGGRLVPDDGWYEALDALLDDRRGRRKLARRARSWAKSQTIAAAVERWEAVMVEAVERRRARPR